jgi:hypothetical protein
VASPTPLFSHAQNSVVCTDQIPRGIKKVPSVERLFSLVSRRLSVVDQVDQLKRRGFLAECHPLAVAGAFIGWSFAEDFLGKREPWKRQLWSRKIIKKFRLFLSSLSAKVISAKTIGRNVHYFIYDSASGRKIFFKYTFRPLATDKWSYFVGSYLTGLFFRVLIRPGLFHRQSLTVINSG